MKHKDIILLLGSAFFLVIAWVAFNVYHNLVASTTPEALEKETQLINPNFDEQTIIKLKERKRISPIYESQRTSPTPLPSPVEPIINPEASVDKENSITSASQEGALVP